MTPSNVVAADEPVRERGSRAAASESRQVPASAVSWSAILAGAMGAAALSLILLILGTGLGLSSVSPWANSGASAVTIGISTILWITFTQMAASGIGGFLAGRLRTRWINTQPDEVYFRDTAHGFLAWAVASLATAALLTSVIGSIISGGVQAGASVVGGVATTATVAASTAGAVDAAKSDNVSGPMGYFVDSLFRRDGNSPAPRGVTEPAVATTEVTRIFMNTIRTGNPSAEDSRYVGQVVAQRTGLSQQDAEKRVTDTYARAQAKLRDIEIATKEAADKARKASAYSALWLFISLLIGAFIASLAAVYGGRQRDL